MSVALERAFREGEEARARPDQILAELRQLRADIAELRCEQAIRGSDAVPIETAGALLGCGRTHVFALLATGKLSPAPRAGAAPDDHARQRRRAADSKRRSGESATPAKVRPGAGRRSVGRGDQANRRFLRRLRVVGVDEPERQPDEHRHGDVAVEALRGRHALVAHGLTDDLQRHSLADRVDDLAVVLRQSDEAVAKLAHVQAFLVPEELRNTVEILADYRLRGCRAQCLKTLCCCEALRGQAQRMSITVLVRELRDSGNRRARVEDPQRSPGRNALDLAVVESVPRRELEHVADSLRRLRAEGARLRFLGAR